MATARAAPRGRGRGGVKPHHILGSQLEVSYQSLGGSHLVVVVNWQSLGSNLLGSTRLVTS